MKDEGRTKAEEVGVVVFCLGSSFILHPSSFRKRCAVRDELFYHVRRGGLPPGSHFHYDPQDPLGRLRHAIGASPDLDAPLPPPPGGWRGCWLAALERHWPLDDDERRLHLAALESSLISSLRDRAAGVAEDRFRAFLHDLGSPCAGPPWCDALLRWLPGDPSSTDDWFDQALRLTARHAAGGASYEVLFPGTWGDETGLIRARLTRLEGLPSPHEQPRVVLAAWSDYLLAQDDAAQLGEQFGALVRRHPERLGDERFLLELLRLEGPQLERFTPPTLVVEGQSLGLAVLLAAWAARSQPSLMPLVATGQLLGGEVRGVESVYEKSDVVREFLELGRPHRFLVPAEDLAAVRGELLSRFPERVVGIAPDADALFARSELLTDGCSAYRAFLAEEWSLPLAPGGTADTFGLYDDADRRHLAEVAARATAEGTRAATALAFGNQPRLAMRQVLASLRGEGPIALPLWLAEDAEGESALARLTWRVGKGLGDVSGRPLVSAEALRNLIGTFADRLLLVAYGRASTSPAPHADDERRWRQTSDDVGSLPRRPRLLLLASDGHHLDRLCPEGGEVARWLFPAGPEGPASKSKPGEPG
jgi:hypothetical protein